MNQKLLLLLKRFNVVLRDENRKKWNLILKEAIIFWIVKRELPYFYFGKFLYRKEIENYKEYLSGKEVDKITLSKTLHNEKYAALLRDKLSFALYMKKKEIPVPELISYNLEKHFFYDSKLYTIKIKEELYQFFNLVLEASNKNSLFVKFTKEMGGKGCYLLTKRNLKTEIDTYGFSILSNNCIHQEVVIQHNEISRIYPHSINTIRFDTYVDKNKQAHILSAFMRFGSGGSVVDNGSAGGIYLSVDLEKGKLKGCCHQLMQYGGKQLASHPDTEIIFDGYDIPFFKESCELIKKTVSVIPDRIIGWDIAISKDGPIIIEGNDNNSFITPDIAYGGYLKHPLFKEILEEA